MPSVLRRTVFALAISLLAGSLLGSASASARPRHRHASSTEASTPSASEAGRSGEAGQAAPTPFESGTSAGTSGVTPPLSEPSPTTRPEAGRQHGKCTVSLEASASVVTAGETVTLLGRLACADTISEAGEAIVVYQREHGAASGLAEVGDRDHRGRWLVPADERTAHGEERVRRSLAARPRGTHRCPGHAQDHPRRPRRRRR